MRLRNALAAMIATASTLFAAGCSGDNSTPPAVVVPAVATATPTAAPGLLFVNAGSLTFTVAGATLSFNAFETGYAGVITATSTAPNSCSGIATFTASAAGSVATINVTSVAAGQCQITVHDTNGQTAAVTVYVTTTSGTVN
ncbi:MAG: hypothetical protein JWO85_2028 [Candidatus Eremiobacteraeota bacterium]|nr:hypothetical protein [Candidatus Eremiobacteraeota bacterium]